MAKQKREYEQRPPAEDGTPFARLQRMAKRVIEVPKAKLDEREREWKRHRGQKS